MTRRQELLRESDADLTIDMAPALLRIDYYIQHQIMRPSQQYQENRDETEKMLEDYLAKLTAIESELMAADAKLTAELAKPSASNPTTVANRYVFTQKAHRLEQTLKHLHNC